MTNRYSFIRTYQQLLDEQDLGSENMQFYDHRGVSVDGVALQTLQYYNIDDQRAINTYGAKANDEEEVRRSNGAYGPVYEGYANFMNPVNLPYEHQYNKFYYLQDLVSIGQFSNLFIEGLTFFQRQRPNVHWSLFNSTFSNDPNVGYYRIDILGSAYPYYHGGMKPDVIIQQFGTGKIPSVSDQLYMTYSQVQTYGDYHSGYKITVPAILPLFNDRLYIITPPVTDPPVDNPPVTDPPIIDTPPVIPPSTPIIYGEGETPYDSNQFIPSSNFGGDTTDTGPTENISEPINVWFSDDNRRFIEYYTPTLGRWLGFFRNW